jgi:predicted Zn finger-like uncharacterized protein
MDVRCGRCGTEYEFDDALISERGTTVKCTNCGFQFKVYPTQAALGVPERWVVRTSSGRELVYTSLRDLQKGISQRQVGPEDLLSRGDRPPRPLGSIAELEPFFQAIPMHAPRQPATLHGVAPPANPHATPPAHPPSSRPPPSEAPVEPPRIPAASAVTQKLPSPPPRLSAPLGAGSPSRPPNAAAVTAPIEAEPPTVPRPERQSPDPALRRPVEPVSARAVEQNFVPVASSVREPMRSYDELPLDSRDDAGLSSRRARSRWIAALVIIGMLGLFGATIGRRYLARYAAQPAAAPTSDPRIAGMLESANRELEEGDMESAKEQLDKATVLGEKDPAVLTLVARFEALRTDLFWLKLRLLDPADESLVQATHKQLGRHAGRAREAVDRAVAAAPEDSSVLRARIDTLRLSGDLAEARRLVLPLGQNASQPENAYVLAALDLAEPAPVWSSIVDRLRTAAASERDLGRARGALIYALVRSGDVGQARTELAKLESRARVHPLLPELQSFVRRHAAAADGGVEAVKEVKTVDPSALPVLDTRPGGRDDDERVAPGDFRGKLKAAGVALGRGDLDRAEQLYNSVLAQQPANTEALAGLGDVARHRRDPATAQKMYEKVLKENPSYLPALIAQADQKWDSGDKKGAIALYRRVLEQAGSGSDYGQRAAARINQGEGAKESAGSEAKADTPPSAEKEPPSESKGSAPPEKKDPPEKKEEPHIDTTDLPELNR